MTKLSTYESVLRTKYRKEGTEDKIREIMEVLRLRYFHMIENLENDCCVLREAMCKLINHILYFNSKIEKKDIAIKKTQEEFVNKCYELINKFVYENVLYSNPIDDNYIVTLGRAISKERFLQLIEDQHKDGNRLYHKLIYGKKLKRSEKHLLLGSENSIIWVTWSKINEDLSDPFGFANDTINSNLKYNIVKTCLGFEISEDLKPFLLIKFKKEMPGNLMYPTIIDANQYSRFKAVKFHPDGTLPPNGQTEPRHEDEFKNYLSDKEFRKFNGILPARPEAIQKSKLARFRSITENGIEEIPKK